VPAVEGARPSARRWSTLVAVALLCACTEPTDEPRRTEAADPAESSALAPEEDAATEEAPASARFTLGTHYRRLVPVQPKSSGPEQVEIAAVFSYRCVPCYELEPELARWARGLGASRRFVRIPAVNDPVTRLHARAFFTAERLGRLDELHAAMFREIHLNGNPLDGKEALAELFGRFGIDRSAFDAAFDSYDVHDAVRRAAELATRYRVEQLPSLVVNGKYTTDPGLAGGNAELLALADFLAAAETSGR